MIKRESEKYFVEVDRKNERANREREKSTYIISVCDVCVRKREKSACVFARCIKLIEP